MIHRLIKYIYNFIIKLTKPECHHDMAFIRDIHGDEVSNLSGARSEWKCLNCGEEIYSGYLYSQISEIDGEEPRKYYLEEIK